MAIPVAASTTALPVLPSTTSSAQRFAASGSMQVLTVCNFHRLGSIYKSRRSSYSNSRSRTNGSRSVVVCAFGDVSSEGTTYLVGGAVAIALLGTAFPILFSRKDLCPECDGAGFTRKAGTTLRVNAARKDETQIVCRRCNGLGKLGQVDKWYLLIVPLRIVG